jgi:hypothetical protein
LQLILLLEDKEMATKATPSRVKDDARPESELSQVLAHAATIGAIYGRGWGGLILLVAIIKATRGPLGLAALATVLVTALYKWWL